jgi:hypothetical protein
LPLGVILAPRGELCIKGEMFTLSTVLKNGRANRGSSPPGDIFTPRGQSSHLWSQLHLWVTFRPLGVKLKKRPFGAKQGCQIFLDTIYPHGGKYDQSTTNSRALQNLPKLGFFGLKKYHLATLGRCSLSPIRIFRYSFSSQCVP